jgi:DNA-binding HxlR family transcriptional regulator
VVARALNLVGDRWALLVVRELLHGPKRFTDLRHGLPTASQNVLSHRLEQLKRAGVVRRRRLGPPVSTSVYELTEFGADLEPVLFQLGRWGSRTPITSARDLSVDALILALKTTYDPAAAGDLHTDCEVRLGDDRFRITIADRRLDLTRSVAGRPDAVIATDAGTFRSLVFGGHPVSESLSDGSLIIEGDHRTVTRLLGLFSRPTPAVAATS